MELKNFRFETDADGIATLTWDMPDRSMNVITQDVMQELGSVVDRVAGDELDSDWWNTTVGWSGWLAGVVIG